MTNETKKQETEKRVLTVRIKGVNLEESLSFSDLDELRLDLEFLKDKRFEYSDRDLNFGGMIPKGRQIRIDDCFGDYDGVVYSVSDYADGCYIGSGIFPQKQVREMRKETQGEKIK